MSVRKRALRFTLCLLPVAVVAGYFTGQYTLSTYSAELLEQAAGQLGSRDLLIVVAMVQTVLYAVICGFFGYVLADKLGLMRRFSLRAPGLWRGVIAGAVIGVLLSLDAWTFAKWIPELAETYAPSAVAFDAPTWIMSILYGGVIEEVMMRLFVMSLLAFIFWKVFARRSETVPTGALIAANILAALLFAAGHLPGTQAMFGALTPLLLLRCFLLNGSFGLVFGRLYRRYGIGYAMIAHALAHIVSRLIWLIALA